ncbi:MAG: hypothetical protein J6X67_00155 [Treponema sp.]|nr:hypothetical protein [Treponema sp.]
MDFFWIAEAKGFCMLLTRPPWLDIAWQERIKHACKEKSPHATRTVIATLDTAIHTNKSPHCHHALHDSTFLGKKEITHLNLLKIAF